GFQKFIPWIALILLAYIGGKMLIEGIGECRSEKNANDKEKELTEGASIADSANYTGESDTFSKSASSSSRANEKVAVLGIGTLLVQGIATAIDALSVGFTIADYNFLPALVECLIIGIVTFVICLGGISIGKEVGDRLSGKAGILGGVILIAIGIEIFVSHI
ncbi:MAG: manganese efflux pump, partial [Firmicutes bacterium]|nr:manganese efflux pump [Bacillota bacterium]